MKTDAALRPLLTKASAHFRAQSATDLASTLDLLAKVAMVRRLNREEVEKVSIIFAPKGPWETNGGAPELAGAVARILHDL